MFLKAEPQNTGVATVADMVAEIIPNSKVVYAPGGEPDTRSYCVDFSKIANALPASKPEWTVRKGVQQLLEAYQRYGLTLEQFEGTYLRIRHLQRLLNEGRLGDGIRWQTPSGPNSSGGQG